MDQVNLFRERKRERDSKPNTINNNLLPRKQNTELSQNNKKNFAKITAGMFKINKWWITNGYF